MIAVTTAKHAWNMLTCHVLLLLLEIILSYPTTCELCMCCCLRVSLTSSLIGLHCAWELIWKYVRWFEVDITVCVTLDPGYKWHYSLLQTHVVVHYSLSGLGSFLENTINCCAVILLRRWDWLSAFHYIMLSWCTDVIDSFDYSPVLSANQARLLPFLLPSLYSISYNARIFNWFVPDTM